MTATIPVPADSSQPPVDGVSITVDGVPMTVPKGTMVIRAAEQIGVEVPRFCDHPLLDPVAACRMCLVEIVGQAKPQPACAIAVSDGMAVKTQRTSEMAELAQRGVMEFLLINHPLDCPVCDKGGECPLQNQAMEHGRSESRFDLDKRLFDKPINLSAQILLDRERCVSCARCTRFAEQIAGDPLIELFERGSKQQVGIADDRPFDSYFSGNTVQVCPVGALTSSQYRFRSRPFDLVSVPTVCEHCSSGCGLRTDVRRSTVLRRLAWDTPEVNEEWNCDKGRFAFAHAAKPEFDTPLVRGDDGILHPATWPEALERVAEGLADARGRSAVLTGGRLTLEDSLAYSKFARAVLGTDDVDFRARPHSTEEADFLAAVVAGSGLGVTYEQLENASVVVLAGLDPEEESPIVFLRLRKAARKRQLPIASIAAWATPGLDRMFGTLLPTAPGAEGEALAALIRGGDTLGADGQRIAALLSEPGAVILVGERLATCTGALSAAAALAHTTGARLAWIPRRAGERGAVEAGLLPGLLPGGRSLTDAQSRVEVAAAWGISADDLPTKVGREVDAIVEAARAGAYKALVVAGVDPFDTRRPDDVIAALEAVPFLVSIEVRPSAVTEFADVVLPVATITQRAGTFVDWEGRSRVFGQVFRTSLALTDARVLAMIADELDRPVGRQDVAGMRNEAAALAPSGSGRREVPSVAASSVSASSGQAVVSTWHHLLDEGTLQRGDDDLAATARTAVARVSAATASAARLSDFVTVSTDTGSLNLPVVVTDMPDGVVWLPTNSQNSNLRRVLGVDHGAIVSLASGGGA